MTSSSAATAPSPAGPRRTAVSRAVAAALLVLLAGAGAVGTIMFGLVLADPPLVGWAIVALTGHVIVLGSLPGLVRGRRWAWTVALCWTVALAYWGLYKLLVEGETESLGFTAAQAVALLLLLMPAGQPDHPAPTAAPPLQTTQ